jgi:hypothetical protein
LIAISKSFFPDANLNFSKFIILLLIILGAKVLFAQEMLGIVNSGYSGITGSVINPAVTVTSPYYLDINIIAGDAFFENNYLYLAKEEYRFSRFFSKNPDYPTHGTNNNQIAYDYYNTKYKNGYVNERILGPSVSVTIGRHAFGIVTGARTVMSVRNVPYEIAKFIYEQMYYPPQHNINYKDTRNIYNAELAWAEYGFNYSYVLKQQSTDYWAAGITVKALKGYAGGYFYGNNEDYIYRDGDTLQVNNFNGEIGYSLPLNYETNEYIDSPRFRGKGIGVDIGVIYEKKKSVVQVQPGGKLCAQNYTPYKYKIGVSIIDIGRIRFNNNAEKLVFNNVSGNWPGISAYNFTTVRNLTDTMSQIFYGNHTDLIQGNEITVGLPTALSVQADVNYYKNWFINGTLVCPLQFSKTGIRRPVLLGLTPRYETAMFEASLPITLYDLSKPRIGLSARFLWFFVGTEKISGFFHYKDFTGLDFYGGIKVSLRKGHCRNGSKKAENCGIEEYKMFNKKSK